MPLTIHCDPCTVSGRKVLSGLDLIGTQYDFKYVDQLGSEPTSAEFTKWNPYGTIPAATDGDLVLTESNAILAYAADVGGTAGERAYPQDVKQRANINRWLLWEASAWALSSDVYMVENVMKPLGKAEPDQAILEAETARFERLAALLDGQLGKTKFVAGDHVTIADIAIAAPMHVHRAAKLPIGSYSNVKRWIHQIEQIPAWSARQAAVEKNLGIIDYVTASLNFTLRTEDAPTELYLRDDERPKSIYKPGGDTREVRIHDGWNRVPELSPDVQGFCLKEFKSQFPEDKWEYDATVREHFYPEVVEFLKKAVGATRVEVFNHGIRTERQLQATTAAHAKPAMLVHCDYTLDSGPGAVRGVLPDEAETLLAGRVALFNVWKPLMRVEESPLAMCDVSTMAPGDIFKVPVHSPGRTGEIYTMRYSDQHQWYYFPKITPDQCILIKVYDSDDQRAQFTGHSAFIDPTSMPDAPLRKSLEIRTMCFF